MKKKIKTLSVVFLLIIFCFLHTIKTFAQTKDTIDKSSEYEKWEKEFFDHLGDWSQEFQKSYDEFKKKFDEEFQVYLKNEWKETDLQKEPINIFKPKPIVLPKLDTSKIEIISDTVFIKKKNELEILYDTTKSSFQFWNKAEFDNFHYDTRELILNFYNKRVSLYYDFEVKTINNSNHIPSQALVYWNTMNNTKYEQMLKQFIEIKTKSNLNDWGYYMLIKKTAEQLANNSQNNIRLFIWFFLIKSGYIVKLGYSQDQIYLLIPTKDTIRGGYYSLNRNIRYYVIDLDKKIKMYSIEDSIPMLSRLFNLSISSCPVFNQNICTRNLEFKYNNNEYEISLSCDTALVNFYKDYPPVQLEIYFNAPMSFTMTNSVLNELHPILKGMDYRKASEFLLLFVQSAFLYEWDTVQFRKEKCFFPDEIIYYPQSDCEDRSMFYANLIIVLLNLEVVGLKYPDHAAVGILFEDDSIPGQRILTPEGKSFLIADPTNEGYPLGFIHKKYQDLSPGIIKIGIK